MKSINPTNFSPCETTIAVHSNVTLPELKLVKDLMKAKYGSTFDVQPHVTHLLFPMFEHKFNECLPKVRDYLRTLKPIHIEFGQVYVAVKKSHYTLFQLPIFGDALKQVHRDLLEIVSPYRDNAIRSKDIERLSTDYYDDKQIAYLLKYGYARVLDLNSLHITLGSCESENCDLDAIKAEISKILEPVFKSGIDLTSATLMFHTNAKVQSDTTVLHEEKFELSL